MIHETPHDPPRMVGVTREGHLWTWWLFHRSHTPRSLTHGRTLTRSGAIRAGIRAWQRIDGTTDPALIRLEVTP